MKNDISQRSNNFIVKLWITNHPVYPSSSGFLRVLDRAWHGCTVGLIWLINCEITMHCTMSRFSPTFYFPMKILPELSWPWQSSWRSEVSRDVTRRWVMTRDLTSVTRAGCELHFLVTETFCHCGSLQWAGAPSCCVNRAQGMWLQAVRGVRLLLPGLRSHNPIIRSQSHIMSPDTSTLLTLAWLVSDIASGQTGHIGYLIIDR